MWSRDKVYHFIGIGGIGVSAVAGFAPAGCQSARVRCASESADRSARSVGISVTIGHQPENINGADVVVHSTAVPRDNLEREAARAAVFPKHIGLKCWVCFAGPYVRRRYWHARKRGLSRR